MLYYIYKHTINDKLYIGFTSKTIQHRLHAHIRESKKEKLHTYFENVIIKYGVNSIKTECLEEISSNTDELAKSREIYWIKYFDTFNSGYNMTTGGSGGNTWTKNQNKDITRKKIRISSLSRVHTEESKEKMRQSAKNRPKQSKEVLIKAEEKRKIKRLTNEYFTKEGLERLKQAGKNKVFINDTKEKLKKSALNRERVKCPYCDVIGDISGMKRWYFKNCKKYNYES